MRKSEQRAFERFPEPSPLRTANVTEEDRLRQLYIEAYEQAERDKNEEIYNDQTVLPKAEAVKFAFNLFDQFAKELITALGNTAKNKREAVRQHMMSAVWTNVNLKEMARMEAMADAFDEIKDRVLKEYSLIMQPIDYNWSINEIYNKMKLSKNFDVDTLLNEDRYIGRNDYQRIMKFKGKLADMLEHYACASFDLGMRYKTMKDKGEDVSSFKDEVIESLSKIMKPNREDVEI
jgi:hypothetical protein